MNESKILSNKWWHNISSNSSKSRNQKIVFSNYKIILLLTQIPSQQFVINIRHLVKERLWSMLRSIWKLDHILISIKM